MIIIIIKLTLKRLFHRFLFTTISPHLVLNKIERERVFIFFCSRWFTLLLGILTNNDWWSIISAANKRANPPPPPTPHHPNNFLLFSCDEALSLTFPLLWLVIDTTESASPIREYSLRTTPRVLQLRGSVCVKTFQFFFFFEQKEDKNFVCFLK